MRVTLAVALSLFALGCSNVGDDGEVVGADDEFGTSENALSGDIGVGTTLRTTTGLNIRSGAGTNFAVLVTVPQGATLTVRVAAPVNGFYAVTYADTEGWASGQYLTTNDAPANAPFVKINGPGVRGHVQAFANAACAAVGGCKFQVGTYNGHQPTADRAIDMMQSPGGSVPNAEGVARGASIAEYGLSNASAHRVDYVIWRQRINNVDGRGWVWMSDRGSITQNHYDHVHVSFAP